VPTGAFGPRWRALLSLLAGAYRLGQRPLRQLVSDLRGRSISRGMSTRRERQGAAAWGAPVEALREHVRRAALAHLDETSWWQGRDKAWRWVAVTRRATVFPIATSRGAEIAKDLRGTAAGRIFAAICRRGAIVGARPPRSVSGCWGTPIGGSMGGTGCGMG
jgi:hypothetical protein